MAHKSSLKLLIEFSDNSPSKAANLAVFNGEERHLLT